MSRKSFAAQGLTHPRVTFELVAGTASTWYTGTVYTNPACDPRPADDPGDLGVVVLDRPEKLPLLLTVPAAGAERWPAHSSGPAAGRNEYHDGLAFRARGRRECAFCAPRLANAYP
jgi:hypothetical protein